MTALIAMLIGLILYLSVFLLCAVIWFLPTFIFVSKVKNTSYVILFLIANLFLSVTIIGWLVLLIYAIVVKPESMQK
jgi:hypothetical protein